MSLTPIVYVQSAASGAEPLPFLATEFVSANLWSMALFIGERTEEAHNKDSCKHNPSPKLTPTENRRHPTPPGNPTNIIVASAFNLTFLGYSKWMLAPTVAAGLAATAVIYLTHRRALPPRLALPDIPPALVLADPWGAVFLTANLAVCVALLAAAPTIRFPMWCITLACAGAACAYCACAYVLLPRARGAARRRKLHGVKSAAELLPHGGRPEVPSSSKHRGAVSGGEPPALAEASQTPSKDPESPTEVATAGDLDPPVTTPPPPPAAAAAAAAANLRTRLTSRRPTFWGPFLGVPWDVAPLVLGFFILVEGLQANGWVDRLGALLGGSARHVVPGGWVIWRSDKRVALLWPACRQESH
jgi:Na+/H+ antiporter NhaD/arsenite permease-like protein